MSFGKLYTYEKNPRSTAILAVAKANDTPLEVVTVDKEKNIPADYTNYNKLGKVPTFVGADGYVLYECIAIAVYVTSQNEKTTLLGKTKQDYASILKWMSFFNQEILPNMGAWYRPLLGKDPYNKKSVEDASKRALKAISVVEEYLRDNTFLVGERITLADLFSVGIIARGFEFFFDTKWRQEYPNVTRWYTTVYDQPIYSAVAPKLELLETPALTNTPPKKPEQPKKEAKPAAAAAPAAAADEDEPKPEPKPKHPCDLLPKAAVPIDEWKRQYSNNPVPQAMEWFWKNMDLTKDYSIWKVEYKYNNELGVPFMSCNLIGGFEQRLEGSRKQLMGSASVYGDGSGSFIQGAFVIRGQEHEPVFNVAPDWESYTFTKLDPNNEEDRKYVRDEWEWERTVVKDGKEYPHYDGKVFK
ncbi:hypothetical protein MCOR25_008739 [Pyricularia grisea]|uniref:Elongation factor 1-gamma-like protein n=1 Tax=Pyricularia grisea TaxID=148305 RepID=A0A6P8B6L0_PYRGI|nr:hypothetical protein PgNI_06019 [Pyricularia grisea]KAI6354121.1 hypothetical protein MCOR25_008739 [Pyricularia grisea]TLD10952.1 hypothetical protein PgNI_06019 [Pyricularia grisea]